MRNDGELGVNFGVDAVNGGVAGKEAGVPIPLSLMLLDSNNDELEMRPSLSTSHNDGVDP